MNSTLYICYFGVLQPLVQTQVIPYLLEIAKSGIDVSLLTFEPDFKEKWPADAIESQRKRMAEMGIDWHCLAYHKRFSVIATAYDVFRGAWFIRRMIGEKNIDVLHGRVHVPTLMGAIARKFSRRKPKLLFDIRGFFPEEYTDAGIWPENGMIYRTVKRIEGWLMKEADAFVILTERAREILFPESSVTGYDKSGRPVEVIPCCVDIERFSTGVSREESRRKLGLDGRFVAVYVGSFGGWYLTEEMIDFFAAAREERPDTFVLILTQRDKEKIIAKLRERGFADDDFLVDSVDPSEIAGYIAAGDIALSFILACYSKQSSSPTKIAEYLACGLPVISNRGIGDLDQLIDDNQVGVMVDEFNNESYRAAMRKFDELGEISERCRETAAREFDLITVGGERYKRLYNKIILDSK